MLAKIWTQQSCQLLSYQPIGRLVSEASEGWKHFTRDGFISVGARWYVCVSLHRIIVKHGEWCSIFLCFTSKHLQFYSVRGWTSLEAIELLLRLYLLFSPFMLHHSSPHPPSLIALILIERPLWIMSNGFNRGTFGSPHVWTPSNGWVAAVWIRWLFIEDIGKCPQKPCLPWESLCWQQHWETAWDMFRVAMTIWVIGERGIVLLDSSHFSLPP